MDDLVSMLPIILSALETVEVAERRALVRSFIVFVKETSGQLNKYALRSTWTFILENWYNSKRGEVDALGETLARLKQNVGLAINADIKEHPLLKDREQELIRIKPPAGSSFDTDPKYCCMPDTRTDLIDTVCILSSNPIINMDRWTDGPILLSMNTSRLPSPSRRRTSSSTSRLRHPTGSRTSSTSNTTSASSTTLCSILDYVYGVAAYNQWNSRRPDKTVHRVMRNYRKEHYINIPAVEPSPRTDNYDGHYISTRTGDVMAKAMDDLNAFLMFVRGITPEEAAKRREKRMEEEELKAQEAIRSKVMEWMRTADAGSS
ncbi:hypothetical protein EDB83DRAFT_2315423 [Lactarius deliciosus]|nr:hypothetical protein EDB83DRAFT_2315423 [Lactarius deliciosus]